MTRTDWFLIACAAVTIGGAVGWWLYGTVDHSGDLQPRPRRNVSPRVARFVVVTCATLFVACVAWVLVTSPA